MAVIGAAKLAHTRLDETYAKYGLEVVERCSELILDRGERRMREAISRADQGEYYHESYMESPQDGAPLLIRVRLSIRDDNVVVDFSESAPQTSGAINGGLASARSGAFIAIKAALDPHSPVNAGAFRPIEVITEAGSMLQAEYPAACCGAMNVINATTEAVMGNLAAGYGEVWLPEPFPSMPCLSCQGGMTNASDPSFISRATSAVRGRSKSMTGTTWWRGTSAAISPGSFLPRSRRPSSL